jgi:hypothetical protein
VTCLEVRDRLVERSLGALHLQDVTEVDRHLAWCAACRKEAEELDRAAATFALTLAPVVPETDLEDRVVRAVHDVHETRSTWRPSRRSRSAAAAAIAAAIVVSALGWGVAMAGRAERFSDAFAQAERRNDDMIHQLRKVVGSQVFEAAGNRAYLGALAPTAGRTGGGSALTWTSPTITDFTFVTVAGLPPENHDALPYRVYIVQDSSGTRLPVGKIRHLDVDGGAMVSQDAQDLTGFHTVIVMDAQGGVVLRGTVGSEASIAVPTP